ncbi:ankyrin repeat domain-containing protein [Parashewanella curva]|uniref:Ankyrin repeat domain-containing protein n=1 Tax=Parashewanella curva TaxID=2338552 RepID=A0A3L8PSG5_9GAMM|nr:ankyrin repeat domain-containing protein [Parashewanella curva]RLV58335.1 ankyrin repeat domain-containing protein [Parashewanella curva]
MTTELTASWHYQGCYESTPDSRRQDAEAVKLLLDAEQPQPYSQSIKNTTTSLWKVGTGVGVGLFFGGPTGAALGGATACGIHLTGRAVEWGVGKVTTAQNAKIVAAGAEFMASGYASWCAAKTALKAGSSMLGGYVASKLVNESLSDETPVPVRQFANFAGGIAGSMLGGMAGGHIETVFALDGTGALPTNPHSSLNSEAKAHFAGAGRTLKGVNEPQSFNTTLNASESSLLQHATQPNSQNATLNTSEFDSLADKLESRLYRPPVKVDEPRDPLPKTDTQPATANKVKGIDSFGGGTFSADSKQYITRRSLKSVNPTDSTNQSCVPCTNMDASVTRVWHASSFSTKQSCFFSIQIGSALGNRHLFTSKIYTKVKDANCNLEIRIEIADRLAGNLVGSVLFSGYYNAPAHKLDSALCCGGGVGVRYSNSCPNTIPSSEFSSAPQNGSQSIPPNCRPLDDVAYNCTAQNQYQFQQTSTAPIPIDSLPRRNQGALNQALIASSNPPAVIGDNSFKRVRANTLINKIKELYPNVHCQGELEGEVNTNFLTAEDYQTAFNASQSAPESESYVCQPEEALILSNQTPQPFDISDLPTGRLPYNRALKSEQSTLVLQDNGEKRVYWQSFIAQLRILTPTPDCVGELQGEYNSESLTYDAYKAAFEAAASAPDLCSNQSVLSITQPTLGSTLPIYDLANTFSINPNVLLTVNGSLPIGYQGLASWQSITEQLSPAASLVEQGCVYNLSLWKNLDLATLQQAHSVANKLPGFAADDCKGGIYNLPFSEAAVNASQLANEFAVHAPNWADVGLHINGNQLVSYLGGIYPWSELLSYSSQSQYQCLQTEQPQPSFKGITHYRLTVPFTSLCDLENEYIAIDAPQQPLLLDELPIGGYYTRYSPVSPDVLISKGSKVVRSSDFISNAQFRFGTCFGGNPGSFNLRVSQPESLKLAFDDTPIAPQSCLTTAIPDKWGDVVDYSDLLKSFNTSTPVYLNGSDLVYRSPNHTQWSQLTAQWKPKFRENGCVTNNLTWREIAQQDLDAAITSAPKVEVSPDNCNSGVTPHTPTFNLSESVNVTELVERFETDFPEFGTIGLRLNSNLELEYNGSTITFEDIEPCLPQSKKCSLQAVGAKSTYYDYKGLTEEDFDEAIESFLDGLVNECIAKNEIERTRTLTLESSQAKSVSITTQPSSIVEVKPGNGNSAGLIAGLVVSGVLTLVGATGLGVVLCLIKRQILDKRENMDVEAVQGALLSSQKPKKPIPQAISMNELQSASNVPPSPSPSLSASPSTKPVPNPQSVMPSAQAATHSGESAQEAKPLPSAVPFPAAEVALKTEVAFTVKGLTNEYVSKLLSACANGKLNQLKRLILSAPSGFNVQLLLEHKPSDDMVSLLHIACAAGKSEVVAYLIGLNANVNSVSRNGVTPLYLAVWQRKTDVVQQLLKANADINIKSNGKTPSALAMELNDDDMIALLNNR